MNWDSQYTRMNQSWNSRVLPKHRNQNYNSRKTVKQKPKLKNTKPHKILGPYHEKYMKKEKDLRK